MKIFASFYFVFCLLFLGSTQIWAQSAIEKAEKLIKQKKYKSAFNELEVFDPENTNISSVLLKQQILLKYFVTSISHQMFILIDLKPREDVMDYRGQDKKIGTQSLIMYSPNEILDQLITQHPNECKLYKALAEFYTDVQLRYRGNWLTSDAEVDKNISVNLQKTIEGNCADFMSYSEYGVSLLRKEKHDEAIVYLQKSIALKNDHPNTQYNLGLAYYLKEDFDSARMYLIKALDLYQDKKFKSDAAKVIGLSYVFQENYTLAIQYLEKANQINPNNFSILRSLIYVYLKTNHAKTKPTIKTFLSLAQETNEVFKELISFYEDKPQELIDILQSEKSKYVKKPELIGAIHFYSAIIALKFDKPQAKKYFIDAKVAFAKVFSTDNQVFSEIEKGIQICDK